MQIIRKQSDTVTFIVTVYTDYLTFEFNHINQSIKVNASFEEFDNQISNLKMVFDSLILANSANGYAEFNLNKIFFNVHDLVDEILDCMDNIEYNDELDDEEELQDESLIPHQSSLTNEVFYQTNNID
jgi:hypothetical protein